MRGKVDVHSRNQFSKWTTRAQLLGSFVNSTGKSNHIVQIVEFPMRIDNFLDEAWSHPDTAKCKVYAYLDNVAMPDQDAKEPQERLDKDLNKG